MRQDAIDTLAAMGITAWLPREAQVETAPQPAREAEIRNKAEPPAEVAPPSEARVPPDAKSRREKEAASEPPAGNAAAMDWGALEYAVANCTHCRLHRSRTQTVFGVGNRKADWMIIGEGPGQQEDRRGEPFVGPAGKLLDSMLKATGRTRADVFIANIVKCRPPRNDDPLFDEAASCKPWLDRQIELIRPRLIIAVGKVAANNLLGTNDNLGLLRGRVHRHPQFDIPIIATYHPAYLLRSPEQKRKSWTDLKMAMQANQPAAERAP